MAPRRWAAPLRIPRIPRRICSTHIKQAHDPSLSKSQARDLVEARHASLVSGPLADEQRTPAQEPETKGRRARREETRHNAADHAHAGERGGEGERARADNRVGQVGHGAEDGSTRLMRLETGAAALKRRTRGAPLVRLAHGSASLGVAVAGGGGKGECGRGRGLGLGVGRAVLRRHSGNKGRRGSSAKTTGVQRCGNGRGAAASCSCPPSGGVVGGGQKSKECVDHTPLVVDAPVRSEDGVYVWS